MVWKVHAFTHLGALLCIAYHNLFEPLCEQVISNDWYNLHICLIFFQIGTDNSNFEKNDYLKFRLCWESRGLK